MKTIGANKIPVNSLELGVQPGTKPFPIQGKKETDLFYYPFYDQYIDAGYSVSDPGQANNEISCNSSYSYKGAIDSKAFTGNFEVFYIPVVDPFRYFCLTDQTSSPLPTNCFQFFFNGTTTVEVRVNNVGYASFMVNPGSDTISFERLDNDLIWKKNGTMIHQISGMLGTDLYIAAVMSDPGRSIQGVYATGN